MKKPTPDYVCQSKTKIYIDGSVPPNVGKSDICSVYGSAYCCGNITKNLCRLKLLSDGQREVFPKAERAEHKNQYLRHLPFL
jgi:hypothetical protein